jgi:ribosomal protein S2
LADKEAKKTKKKRSRREKKKREHDIKELRRSLGGVTSFEKSGDTPPLSPKMYGGNGGMVF